MTRSTSIGSASSTSAPIAGACCRWLRGKHTSPDGARAALRPTHTSIQAPPRLVPGRENLVPGTSRALDHNHGSYTRQACTHAQLPARDARVKVEAGDGLASGFGLHAEVPHRGIPHVHTVRRVLRGHAEHVSRALSAVPAVCHAYPPRCRRRRDAWLVRTSRP